MRSLTVKLTLAFVLIGTIGAVLVAVLVGQRTRSELDRLVSEHDQSALVQGLSAYYAANGNWRGVADMLASTPQLRSYSRGMTLADHDGFVVFGDDREGLGQQLPESTLAGGTAVTVNDKTVGTVLFGPVGAPPGDAGRPPPDIAFLNRVTWASAMSAAVASLLALVLGVVLARTLTRPLRELTAATQVMAKGELGHHVKVRSRDEIGELAQSFNQMSGDLARASQARKQMTADLAHDLRTPLSILLGYTEGLEDGRLQGTPKLYTLMHGEVKHLQRLVEDLRLLSLADAGELTLNRRSVDPTALLERTALAYIDQAEQRGIGLHLETPERLPSVDVDTDRMTQVLNNLVSNAIRYTNQGEITLRAWSDGSQVQLQVRDTGQGITAEDLPLIFDRFYRADQSRHRDESSASGLGLAITKAIVEAHQGTIGVESSLGKGTAFTITLPAVPNQTASDRPSSSEHLYTRASARKNYSQEQQG